MSRRFQFSWSRANSGTGPSRYSCECELLILGNSEEIFPLWFWFTVYLLFLRVTLVPPRRSFSYTFSSFSNLRLFLLDSVYINLCYVDMDETWVQLYISEFVFVFIYGRCILWIKFRLYLAFCTHWSLTGLIYLLVSYFVLGMRNLNWMSVPSRKRYHWTCGLRLYSKSMRARAFASNIRLRVILQDSCRVLLLAVIPFPIGSYSKECKERKPGEIRKTVKTDQTSSSAKTRPSSRYPEN